MKDSHIHTTLSHDGKSDMAQYIAEAKKRGIDEIIFTEHADIVYDVDTPAKSVDMEEYKKTYEKYKDASLPRAGFGIEIGLRSEKERDIKELLKGYELDFIIGSSHITKGISMTGNKDFFAGKTRKEAYMIYLEETLKNINTFDDFDVYGHIDYIVRYGGYKEKYLEREIFGDIIDEILKALIKKDKGIEINTSGFRYGIGAPHPAAGIIKRYKELGGKIITVGSDAHNAKDMCSFFPEAYEILKNAGFSEAAVFHKRKPEFYKI